MAFTSVTVAVVEMSRNWIRTDRNGVSKSQKNLDNRPIDVKPRMFETIYNNIII